MTKNPFDATVLNHEKEDKIYLIGLISWSWVFTDAADDEGEPFYDRSEGGRLFCGVGNCPLCGHNGCLEVAAGYSDHDSVEPIDWWCQHCEEAGNILWKWGELEPEQSGLDDDEFIWLPSHVVIEVER